MPNLFFLIFLPILGFTQAIRTPLHFNTALWSVLLWMITGVGITAGYHRLWSHTAYSAGLPLRIFLAIAGGAAFEQSIRWWAKTHRVHHKYTDTDLDPYSIEKGFWHAHIGWLLFKSYRTAGPSLKVPDLDADPVVVWQHRNYALIVLCAGIIFPVSVPGLLWNDWAGGFVYAFILRMFFVHHVTFSVNSIAHTWGEQPFDRKNSPRDHIFTAILTFGEGYHNFHHKFPSDYRNGTRYYHYDPTKWFIRSCKVLGLAYDLKAFPAEVLERTRMTQKKRSVFQKEPTEVLLDTLPVWTRSKFENEKTIRREKSLVIVANIVHDVTGFVDKHPDGQIMLRAYSGKDASDYFNGAIHGHTHEARKILASLRIAVIEDQTH